MRVLNGCIGRCFCVFIRVERENERKDFFYELLGNWWIVECL